MGRIGISYQDVSNTISKLQAQGRTLTVDNIREILGTGSKSTIARLLREWKQQQNLSEQDDGALPSELMTMIKELWLKLHATADERIESHQEECDAALNTIQLELNQYKIKETEWKDKIDALEKELQQYKETNQALNTALITEQKENIKSIERIEALQARLSESQSESERLHQLLSRAQANLDQYQNTAQQTRSEQDKMAERQRKDYEHKLVQLQQQADSATREKIFLEARCIGLDENYDVLMAKYVSLESHTQELQKKNSALQLDYAKLAQENERISQELTAQNQTVEGKIRELIEYRFRLELSESKIASLQKSLSAAENKIIAFFENSNNT